MSLRNAIRRWLGVADPVPPARAPKYFSTDSGRTTDIDDARKFVGGVSKRVFQRTAEDFKPIKPALPAGMDAAAHDLKWSMAMDDWNLSVKGAFTLNNGWGIPDAQIEWYAGQGFIGYQMCAILAQQWLVDKACTMPAKDATRNGWELTVNDNVEVPDGLLDFQRKLDRRFKIKKEAREFVRNCRIFGIRIAIFVVESDDPEYYLKPFNIDGVKAGSYKGISQVDPYWITPELDMDATANPASMHFYEPTYWRVSGKRYHRSHLVIIKTCEVPDVLKPTYFYGGVPLTQRIYERVYASERTANEAPQLALTKRSTVIHVDLAAATANQKEFEDKLRKWAYFRDNYGIKAVGEDESVEQFDTSLSDFDEVVMSQYGLVCAIAGTPITKMMGNQPKGFNATGEYEEASYHEELEGIQEHDVAPLVERHNLLCMRAYVMPKFGLKEPIEFEVVFNELDAETAAEKTKRTLDESTRDKNWADAGAIDGIDIRTRIINDPDSGYNATPEAIPEGPRPISVVDPGAEKTAPNAPTPAEQTPPAGGSGAAH